MYIADAISPTERSSAPSAASRSPLTSPPVNIAGGLDDYDTPSNRINIDSGISSGWSNQTWYYCGYKTLDELYSNAVTQNVEDYNHQDNVG